MLKTTIRTSLFGLALIAAPAYAADVTVHNPYAFATAEGQANGAAFMSLHNGSETDAHLTSASGDVAASIELHTHVMDGDVMQMRATQSHDIMAGETLDLKPAGDHIMLMGLNAPLEEGSHFTLTLTFADGTQQDVDVPVVAAGSAPMMDDAHGDHGEMHEEMHEESHDEHHDDAHEGEMEDHGEEHGDHHH